ncbi:MAG TPA: carbohydrate ABC transporter substrate-binding protein, partial [Chloroflexi bacterium]|nr:carbohydrate ABC transporter substrate-binding protein [Chloroflexota bacterium]
MSSNQRIWRILSLLLIFALLLTACTPTPTETPVKEATEEPTREEPVAKPEVDFNYPPGGYLERALTGEFAGTEVTVDGPFADADEVKFNRSMAAFEEATGITVNYIGNKEFEGSISIRVDAGDAPDIADFPQPG